MNIKGQISKSDMEEASPISIIHMTSNECLDRADTKAVSLQLYMYGVIYVQYLAPRSESAATWHL